MTTKVCAKHIAILTNTTSDISNVTKVGADTGVRKGEPMSDFAKDTNVPTNDCISRQAAINALVKAIREDPYYDSNEAINGLGVCDVRVILNDLPPAQPEYRLDEWCTDCKEYDTEKHCCPRFNQVIRTTLNEMKSERKKGKWETVEDWDGDEHYRCSKCGAEFVLIDGTHVHMNYGDFLRRARLDAGLTQTELAKRMGVTPQYISQYERNNRMPKTETVVKFAKALGTPENNDYYFCPHCGARMKEEDA